MKKHCIFFRVFDAAGSVKGPILPEEHSSGDILVEVEPVRYELDIHDTSNDKMLKNRPKTTKEKKQLAKSSLFRFDEGRDAEARLQKVLSYAYDKSEYYGQVHNSKNEISIKKVLKIALK